MLCSAHSLCKALCCVSLLAVSYMLNDSALQVGGCMSVLQHSYECIVTHFAVDFMTLLEAIV